MPFADAGSNGEMFAVWLRAAPARLTARVPDLDCAVETDRSPGQPAAASIRLPELH